MALKQQQPTLTPMFLYVWITFLKHVNDSTFLSDGHIFAFDFIAVYG